MRGSYSKERSDALLLCDGEYEKMLDAVSCTVSVDATALQGRNQTP